jgi:carbonic anhydrase
MRTSSATPGVITDDQIRSLAISQRLLGTEEIVLIHHTDCGMLTFRIHASPFIPVKSSVRGFVYDVHDGSVREVKPG